MNTQSAAICSAVLATIALVFSLLSVSWCEFVYFDVAPTTNPDATREVSFGMWRYSSFVLVGVENDGGGIDVYKVDTCEGYPDDLSIDAYWKAAKSFSIIAPSLGALAAVGMCALPKMSKMLGLVLLITAASQGLVLLFLKSDVCDEDSNPMFVNRVATKQDSCELGPNSIINIVSMILWFLAAVVPCAGTDDASEDVPQPEPEADNEKLGDSDDDQEETGEADNEKMGGSDDDQVETGEADKNAQEE